MKKAKRFAALLICAVMALAVAPAAGYGAGRSVTVTVAGFDVFLNGVLMDSRNSEYPLIVYRNITYVPMTWNLTRFMGLKTRYDKRGGENIFFIGNAAGRVDELEEDRASSRNKSSYSAYVADYKLAVNDVRDSHFIDNSREQYPILTFREITYFPLTWKFAHDCFGWDYYYDNENGLSIDSRNAFRPEWNEDVIWSSSAASSPRSIYYAYNDNAYVGWRDTDVKYNFGGELIWGRRGLGETTVDLTGQMTELNIARLNRQFKEETESAAQPRIDGSKFYIRALAREANGRLRTYDLTIDLAAGKITDVKEVLFDSRGNITGTVTPLDSNGETVSGGSDGTLDLGGSNGSDSSGSGSDGVIDLGDGSDGTLDLDGGGDGVIVLDGDDGEKDGTLEI